jgi:hypothetical protein
VLAQRVATQDRRVVVRERKRGRAVDDPPDLGIEGLGVSRSAGPRRAPIPAVKLRRVFGERGCDFLSNQLKPRVI